MSESLDLRPLDLNWRDKFDDKQYAIAFTEEVLASHRSLHAEAEDLSRQLEEARGRIGELEIEMQKLQDPASVHLNMLAGRIAKITMMQCAHTHGEEAVREFRAKDARIAELEAALKQLTDLINLREWILQGTPEEILQAFRKAHAALEGESREAGD